MVTVIYVLVNISYLTVMSPGEMLVSDAVAVTFGNRILGPLAWLMPLADNVAERAEVTLKSPLEPPLDLRHALASEK